MEYQDRVKEILISSEKEIKGLLTAEEILTFQWSENRENEALRLLETKYAEFKPPESLSLISKILWCAKEEYIKMLKVMVTYYKVSAETMPPDKAEEYMKFNKMETLQNISENVTVKNGKYLYQVEAGKFNIPVDFFEFTGIDPDSEDFEVVKSAYEDRQLKSGVSR